MNDAKDFDHVLLFLYQINNAVGMMKDLPDVVSLILGNHSTFLGLRYKTFSLLDNFFDGSVGIKCRIFCNVLKDMIELFLSLFRPGNFHLAN